jgi:ATP-dependent Clp protease ATP-binding subunit ClpC
MFELFTSRARQVVVSAQEEAVRLGHRHVGAEHLLIGLLDSSQGLAASALAELGMTREKASEEAERINGSGGVQSSPGQIAFTEEARAVLEASRHEAIRAGSDVVDSEHVLLALAARDSGTQSLANVGLDPDAVRAAVIRE